MRNARIAKQLIQIARIVSVVTVTTTLTFNLSSCASRSKPSNQLANPASPTAAQSAEPSINAFTATIDEPGRIYLANRRLSFLPPDGFVPMPVAEIAKKYPADNQPLQVFTNGDRTATIAITLTQQPLTLSQLPELQGLMSKHLEKTVPGLKWIRKDLLAINGGSWLNMEGTSQDKAGKLHSDMYFTSFQERMIGVNFSAEAGSFSGLKKSFQKSRDSIQVMTE
jgi:hypothetical protein